MKKTITLLVFTFLFLNSYGQTASKNEEHCRFVISTKHVDRMNAVFKITTLNSSEQNNLADFLYLSSHSIYDVKFSNDSTINIYHISDIDIDDLKSFLVQQNYYIELLRYLTIQNINQ